MQSYGTELNNLSGLAMHIYIYIYIYIYIWWAGLAGRTDGSNRGHGLATIQAFGPLW